MGGRRSWRRDGPGQQSTPGGIKGGKNESDFRGGDLGKLEHQPDTTSHVRTKQHQPEPDTTRGGEVDITWILPQCSWSYIGVFVVRSDDGGW